MLHSSSVRIILLNYQTRRPGGRPQSLRVKIGIVFVSAKRCHPGANEDHTLKIMRLAGSQAFFNGLIFIILENDEFEKLTKPGVLAIMTPLSDCSLSW